MALSDYRRVKVLSSISDFDLTIYGSPAWATDYYNEPFLILNYDKTRIFSLSENQTVYNTSKIGININHLQARDGFSWIVADVLASNACLVTDSREEIVKLFGKFIPMYDSIWDARGLCKKLLTDEPMRIDIVKRSNEIINNRFRFSSVKKWFLDESCGFLQWE